MRYDMRYDMRYTYANCLCISHGVYISFLYSRSDSAFFTITIIAKTIVALFNKVIIFHSIIKKGECGMKTINRAIQ